MVIPKASEGKDFCEQEADIKINKLSFLHITWQETPHLMLRSVI